MQISNAQSRAIAHGAGPAMVLAGPGSGKTLVITRRTKYLIEELKINPRQILVITFTKAAAEEMRERFGKLCRAPGVTFGTFHAVFFGILKHAYGYTAANIVSEEQKYQILQQQLHARHISAEDEKELLSELASEISMVKNERISLEHYYSRSCPEEAFRAVYQGYEKACRERSLIDFDDMMTYTYELLRARSDILRAWQQRFRYILVDEFQDINLLQYDILKLLAAPGNNLFIVGDDDQSIYRFRGAKPEIMLNFPKEFPEAKMIVLDQNFRSTAPVIRGALQVIGENTHRFEKKIRHTREGGSAIDVREFDNQDHESLYLVKCIQKAADDGVPLSEMAVLFRTNQGAGPFAERMMEFNLPFEMRDALPNIYDHWIAKDIFAYLHLAHVRMDRTRFFQVMNRPKRYISRDSAASEVVTFEALYEYYQDKEWMTDRISRLETDLRILKGLKPYAAVNYIRQGMHYEEYLQEYAAFRKMKPEELTDLLDEIQQGARPYQTIEEWYAHIEAYRQKLLERRGKKQKKEDAVIFATLHSSKGLEFSEVFLVDINEGFLPHKKAMTEADLEEERRLFYVGMTRAKDRLHLFYAKERFGKAVEPSVFLDGFLEDRD